MKLNVSKIQLLLIFSALLIFSVPHTASASELEKNISPEFSTLSQSKEVTVYKYYTKGQFPTRYDVPHTYWYDDGTYRGYIYTTKWNETKDGYNVWYSGNVLIGPYVPLKN